MDEVTFTIDGREVEASPGMTVMDAALLNDIYIPGLCNHPDLKPVGACRLCLVEVEGAGATPACLATAEDGLVVTQDGPEINQARRQATQFLVANNHSECRACARNAPCELQRIISHVGVDPEQMRRLSRPAERLPIDTSNPFFDFDPNSCVLCGICVRTCDEIVGVHAIDFAFRGDDTSISVFANKPLVNSRCVSCGECVVRCPVGSLMPKRPRQPTREVKTVCSYCGVGCGIYLGVRGKKIVASRGDPDSGSNLGLLCVKGRYGYNFVNHKDRLTTPLIRRDGELKPAKWDEALEYVAEHLARYAGDQFATLCSAKATNEDGYVQQKFARLLMQSNHVDHCARLCHAPSVVAMMAALGSGATSNSYVDYEEAGCLMLVGTDPDSNHPVVAARIRRAVSEHGASLIVINPRRVEMCDLADLWLRPRPGTDVTLLNAMAKVILNEELADTEFVDRRTEGFDKWKQVIDQYDLEDAERVTGVPAGDITRAARIYARPLFSGSCLIWGMGITQHTSGTANAHSLVNLALVAGQMGRPGSGISPLRGQNNVQGCGDAGCLPNTLPGYQMIDEAGLARFQAAWGGRALSGEPGLMLTEAVEAMLQSRIKAVYMVGENPLLSEPDLHHAEEAFKKLEFLVVQDIFLHETAQIADVVLPATSFAEKDGTFTNSERRVQRVRRAIQPIGESRPDWEIICDLARRVSKRLNLNLEQEFIYGHPSEIWDEMAGLIPFITGISYDRLDREGGLQWPCTAPEHPGTRYLYEDDFPRGPRARFAAFDQAPEAEELPSRRFPLILNTGRVLYHWHGGTITRRDSGLMARFPELQIALSAEDGKRYSVADGEWVRLVSRRGEVEGRVLYTEKMRVGEVFVPFVKLQKSAANFLTNAAFDSTSGIPEYKVCAVRIDKISRKRTAGRKDGRGRR